MKVTVTFKLWTQINCTHYYANVLVFSVTVTKPRGQNKLLAEEFVWVYGFRGRLQCWEGKTAGAKRRNHSLHCRPTAERAKWRKGEAKAHTVTPSDVLPPAKLSLLNLPPKQQPDTKSYLPEPLGNFPHSEYHTDYLTYSVTSKKSWLAYVPGWGSINKLFSRWPSSLLDWLNISFISHSVTRCAYKAT